MSANYTEAVEAAGGVPVVLPPQRGNIDSLLSIVDGVLFSGGGDVDPERYGDTDRHPTTYGVHQLRDTFEVALFLSALERGVPILCICRGIQVANVALGGTLIQDIADQHGIDIEHRQHAAGYSPAQASHDVHIAPGTLMEHVFGGTAVSVNSYHHQAIRDLSPELRLAGSAPDGVIEAVDRPVSRGWFLGVQWHPEMMFREHEPQLQLFTTFVAAARENRRSRVEPASVLGT
jgi:putative glutamine amidotransferase